MKKKYTKRINLELNLLNELNYRHIYTDTITTNSELYFYTNYGCVKIVLLPNYPFQSPNVFINNNHLVKYPILYKNLHTKISNDPLQIIIKKLNNYISYKEFLYNTILQHTNQYNNYIEKFNEIFENWSPGFRLTYIINAMYYINDYLPPNKFIYIL